MSAVLWDIEAPEYDEAHAFRTVRQAMEPALRSEENAHTYFVAALEHVREAVVRTLPEELRDDEVLHQNMIRRGMGRLGAEAEIDTANFTDEPDEPTSQ